MFYKKNKKFKKILSKDIVLSKFADGPLTLKDSAILTQKNAKVIYNYSFNDGALSTGLGFKELTIPSSWDKPNVEELIDFKSDEIIAIWYIRWYNMEMEKYLYILYFMRTDYQIRYIFLVNEFNGVIFKNDYILTSVPFCYNYRLNDLDCVCFSSATDGIVVIKIDGSMKYTNGPKVISSLVHYDKFFGLTAGEKNSVVYSSNLDFTSWVNDDKKTVEFQDNLGSFIKLVSFNDYVYIFRQHGITKISAYTSSGEFSKNNLWTSSGFIYRESIEICGDKILFMTRDGLYCFNGASVSKIETDYNEILYNMDKTHCSAACLSGKYYLAGRYDFNDEELIGCENNEDYVNNVLFEIDCENYDLNILRGVDIKKIVAIDNPVMSKLVACFNGDYKGKIGELTHDGKIMGKNLKKNWKSANNDLGYAGQLKQIKKVILKSLGDCIIKISSDREEKEYKVYASSKEQTVNVNVIGNLFEVSFITNECDSCKISAPKIIFNVQS